MKYTSLAVLAALFAVSNVSAVRVSSSFAPPAAGPYASDTDHLSTECYGADEDDIMYDVFERYRVEEKNPMGASTGIWKLPKSSGPQWAADIIRRFHVMKEDKIDEYVAANFDNFWKKYDNNGTGEIYESETETFIRALLGPNNRFRLAEGALSDMDSAAQRIQNEFSATPAVTPFAHRYVIETPAAYHAYPVSNPSAPPM
jgi:hypothetical protein